MIDLFYVVPVCVIALFRDSQLLAICPKRVASEACAAYAAVNTIGVAAIVLLHNSHIAPYSTALLGDANILAAGFGLHVVTFVVGRRWLRWCRVDQSWKTALLPMPSLMIALAVLVYYTALPLGITPLTVVVPIGALWTTVVFLMRRSLLNAGTVVAEVSFVFKYANATSAVGVLLLPALGLAV